MKCYIFFLLIGINLLVAQMPELDIERIFQRFDRDQDEKLSQQEIPPMIWQRLARADFNQDGWITKQELQRVKNAMQRLGKNRPNSQEVKENKSIYAEEKLNRKEDGTSFFHAENWSAFDAGSIGGLDTKGYFGAVCDGRYVYYVPCRTRNFHARVLRYDTQGNFQKISSWASYDAGKTDGLESKGYAGGVFDGRYVYFVPMATENARHAVVLRYDTQKPFQQAKSWNAYNAQQVAGRGAMGYIGAVLHGQYIYFVPFGYTPYAHGYILRYNIKSDFTNSSSWEVYDAGQTSGLLTKGFYGAVSDTRYIYFVPFHDGKQFHGRVLRYDSQQNFHEVQAWKAYDVEKAIGQHTVGYKSAIFDGRYIYFVPFRDNENVHTRVLRYDTQAEFQTPTSWALYSADKTDNLDTRGYVGAVWDQRYIYFVPYSGENNIFHANFLRYDTQKDFLVASSWSSVCMDNVDGLLTKGYKFAACDGSYIYFAPYHNNANFSGIVLRLDIRQKK